MTPPPPAADPACSPAGVASTRSRGRLRSWLAAFHRTTAGGSYVPQIDGLRLLAILPVVLWHVSLRVKRFGDGLDAGAHTALSLVPSGHIGVALFFFVSGYIISYPYVTGRAPTAGRFYLRRLTRITPPYLIVLLICFVPLGLLGYVPDRSPSFEDAGDVPLWASLAASAAYLHGLLFQAASRLDPPAWSLEIEMQFYLLTPLLAPLYMRIPRFAARVAAAAALALTCSLAARWLDARDGRAALHAWTLLPHAYAFLAGVAASDWASRARPFQRPGLRLYDLAIVAGLAGLAVSGVVERAAPGFVLSVADDVARVALLLMVYAGACRGRFSRRWLGWAPFAAVGAMVYSIYLTHVPLIQALSPALLRVLAPLGFYGMWAADLALMTAAILVVGAGFFLLVEKPFMDPGWPKRVFERSRALRFRRA